MKNLNLFYFILFLSLIFSEFSFSASKYIRNVDLIPKHKRILAPNFFWNKENNTNILKGQVIYINFWAESCSPCKEEIPFLLQVHNFFNYPVFKMIFVNMDPKNKLNKAKSFWKQKGKDAPSLFVSEFKFKNEFSIDKIPSHILIDKKGRIALEFFGEINNQKMGGLIKKWIFQLIQEKDVLTK